MATIYYDAGATGSGDGSSFANAYTTMAAAVSAMFANDVLFVASDSRESITVDTAYTFPGNNSVICVNKVSGNPETQEAAGGYLGHTSTNRSIVFACPSRLYVYGMELVVTGNDQIRVSPTDGQHTELEDCHIRLNGSNSFFDLGALNNDANRYVRMRGGKITFGNANNGVRHYSAAVFEGVVLAGTAPSVLVPSGSRAGNLMRWEGCDLSLVTGTLVAGNTTEPSRIDFINCKLGSGVTRLSYSATNLSGTDVFLFDCASGDEHYHFEHHNALGSLTTVTSIYANDGAKYDGTNGCCWKIETTANAYLFMPYITPWFDQYHDGTSAVTPSIEILRDGSTTPFTNVQVWGEWAYKGTAGSTMTTLTHDRRAVLGSVSNQDNGAGLSNWTGESGSAWSGKLEAPGTITPAEIGHIRGRVCVGLPSTVVYVDPQTRLAP